MRPTFSLLLALSLLAGVLFSGCAGYQLGPVKPQRYADVQTIAVTTFKNRTLEPRLEMLMTNTLIKQIQQDGTFKIANEAQADAVLEAEVEELDRRPARSLSGNVLLAREYTLTIRARYKFYRRATGEVLEQRAVNGQTSFFATGSSVLEADVNQDERQAIPLAAEDLAVRLTSQISEGW